MKKLFLLLIVFFTVTLAFANINPKDGRLNVYSNGNTSIGESTKVVKYKGLDVKIFVGVDKDYKISDISLSDNLSKEDFAKIKAKILAANCFTTCSRANHCSDKPTMAGVIGCYAECGIDCVQEAMEQ